MKVRCINTDNEKLLTIGKIYDVVSEVEDYYRVHNNKGKLIGMDKSRFEIVKESTAMNKEYSFSEMIKAYEDGYKGQFKDNCTSFRVENKGDALYWINKDNRVDSRISVCEMNMRTKFYKIDREVPVHEAIKALKEGKAVYFMIDEDKYSFTNIPEQEGDTIELRDLTTRKWYISE